MAKLERQIEKDDIPKIKKLLIELFDTDEYKDIERLGGMMNHSYKIVLNNNEEYLVRIPGEGTNEMVNRKEEKINTELACNLEIDSDLLYMDEEGYKVMKFIKNPQNMDDNLIKKEDVIRQAAEIFNKLHNSNVDTGVYFEFYEKAKLYEKIINDYKVALYDDYNEIKNIVVEMYEEIASQELVPCHNDCLVANWVLDEDNRLYLIDWEFAGMNHAMWDLSCLSIEANYEDEEDKKLLNYYFKRPVTKEEEKEFITEKIFIDYLWTLWGLTRVPFDGDFMQEYADERYERLHENIKKYQKIK